MSGALNKEEWLAACGDLAKTYEQAWEEANKQMTDIYGTDPIELYRSEDPDTSAEAAHSVDTTKLEKMVHDAIEASGHNGCIAADLLAKFPYLPYSSVTARFSALERKRFITCGPDKRTGPSKRNQRVMRAGVYKVASCR